MLKKILIPKVYLPIIYVVGALIIYAVLARIIDKSLLKKRKAPNKTELYIKRETTIINLFKSILKYIIAIIVILAILNVYEVETTSIIASIGIVGAIIGLAFQDTIKNLLSGITIIFDNHYMQGDIVTINGFRGEVIELGLQATKVKSYGGEVLIINNCEIKSVINHSMYDTYLYLDFLVSKDVSLSKLEELLNNVNKKLVKLKEVNKDIELLGIEKLNGNSYVYKVLIDCIPDGHFVVNRKFMGYLKEEFDKNNIKVPGDYIEVNNRKNGE